jgi:cystathionine gamma-lyase
LTVDFIDLTDIELVKKTINENTRVIWIETPTNPTLKICDIKLLCEIAHERGVIVVADNTFATPYLQSPILLGADIVVNSCTKYVGGHSDVVQGALCLNDKNMYEHLFLIAKTFGGNPGAFDSYLALRGLKTLKIRVD